MKGAIVLVLTVSIVDAFMVTPSVVPTFVNGRTTSARSGRTTTTKTPVQRLRSQALFSSTNEPRHDVGAAAQKQLSPEEQKKMEAYGLYQQSAPKLNFATDVRSLVQYNHGFAVLSTFSKADPQYPSGSVVGFAPDDDGKPIFIFSGMSGHTQDVLANPYCSLTVAAKDFKGAADGRVNLFGKCELVKSPAEKEKVKAIYLKKHPGAFWVDFGDFNWFTMSVDKVRFVGGFARAGQITADEYKSAKPDPIAEFGPAIASHMNEDHMDSTIAMIEALIPGMEYDPSNPITDATITSVDSLGMYIKVTRENPVKFLPKQFKLRLPFPRQAVDRKDVRALIVELTQATAESTTTRQAAASKELKQKQQEKAT